MLVSEVPAFRDYWYPICYADEVDEKPRPFRLFADNWVTWRDGAGTVRAARDRCPHRAARLSMGWMTNGCLVCPYHGWRFDGDGQCVEIPAAPPDLPIPPRARLEAILADERYGLVWVCVGMPAEGIPVLPELEDPTYTLVHELIEEWSASAPRCIDNALDVSHLSFVHRASIGSDADPRLSDFDIERDGTRLRFTVSYISRVSEQQKRNTGITEDFITRTTHAELVQPFVFRGVLEYPNGLTHVLYKTAAPVDDEHTLFCQFIARNDDPDDERQRGIIDVDRDVQCEDRALLEGIEADFPLQPTAELHTRSDRMTLEYRRILAELADVSAVRPLVSR
jgi:phenylpropionate dioxygenase-like ring-hydroxylating dioxygenase large terminal subunit